MRRIMSVALALGASLSASAASADDEFGLRQIQTQDLRLIYYAPLQTYLTPYAAQAYENSFAFQQRMFDWKAHERPTVLLTDLADNGGATVRAAPNNALFINIAPIFTTFETFTPGERFFTLMNHELTHVATMDVANDRDRWWRATFHGKPIPQTEHPETILYSFLTTPRTNVPRWYLEGSAVFMETWMGGGLGRAQGGYDEMVFRAMVRDKARFFDPLGLEAKGNAIDFQVGANDYLYGTRFFSYLALTYSPEKVVQWLKRGPDSRAYYAAQFEHVFGKSLNAAWADWIAYEHTFQARNLAEVGRYPLTPVERLANGPMGSVSRAFYDAKTDSLIAGVRAPGVIANISVTPLKGGPERRLVNIKGPALYRVTSLAFDAGLRKVYYTTDNNALRDLMEIDLASGRTRMLNRDGRVGDLVVNPVDHAIWGVRHLNGVDTLVRFDRDAGIWRQIVTYPYGRAVSDLDISPDGAKLAASIAEINGEQRIAVFDLNALIAGDAVEQRTLKLAGALPEGAAFSPDGRYVYATAYYTGISNVYRLDMETGETEAVSNAATGLFRPAPQPDGSVIAFEYTGDGLAPVRFKPQPLNDLGAVRFLGTEVAKAHPEVKTWGVGSPARIPIDSMITQRGAYVARHELQWDASYPYVAGYKGHAAAGWYVQAEDPLQYNTAWASLSVSPAQDLKGDEKVHADIGYRDLFWHAIFKYNGDDFYDLFGPVRRSRKGEALLTGYKTIRIYDPPRQLSFTADLNLYSDLDTLPGAQNVRTSGRQLGVAKVGFDYSDIDKSLGAVDQEQGRHFYGALSGEYSKQFFPHLWGGYDMGRALDWRHASVWLYTAAGVSGGDRLSPLRNYYLGAFGNNFVDDRDEKRYRDWDSFPGFKIDALGPRDFARSIAEFNLPPLRFDNVGTPSYYLSSARTALFGGALVGNPGARDRFTAETLGFQTDLNFTVAVRLPLTLSFGYAHGFGGTGRRDELMASLKILYTPAGPH